MSLADGLIVITGCLAWVALAYLIGWLGRPSVPEIPPAESDPDPPPVVTADPAGRWYLEGWEGDHS